MPSLIHQLYKTKLQLAAVVAAVLGTGLLTLSRTGKSTALPVLHWLIGWPTKGLHVQFDHAGAGIRRVTVLDFIASSQQSRVEQAPSTTQAKTIDVGFDGWIFPRLGVAFVWVLEEELTSPMEKTA